MMKNEISCPSCGCKMDAPSCIEVGCGHAFEGHIEANVETDVDGYCAALDYGKSIESQGDCACPEYRPSVCYDCKREADDIAAFDEHFDGDLTK